MGKYPFDKPKFWEKKPSKDPEPLYPCSCLQPYIDKLDGTITIDDLGLVGHVSYKKMPCEEIISLTKEDIEDLNGITFVAKKGYTFGWTTYDQCLTRIKAKEKKRIDSILYEELPMHLNEIDTSCIPDYFINKLKGGNK